MTRLLTAFLIVMLLPATAAAAAPSCPDDNADELGGTGEVWGIGPDYVIAGVPERSSAAGGIVVREGRHTPRTVTLAHVPGAGAPAPGDRFGAALASGMVSFGRPCNDLVAGAPGRNGTGEAYLLRGSTGARPREAVILRAPDAAPGDAFGAAVALSPRDESADHDIWVGAPGRDVAGQADAGAIYHWALNADGVPSFVGVVTQGPGLDAPEAGDRLGEVLAPAMGAAIAGLPHEDAGDRADAGAVMLLPAVGDGALRSRVARPARGSARRSTTAAAGSPPARRAPTCAAARTPASSPTSACACSRAARSARACAACPAAPRPATASAARSPAAARCAARRTARWRSACPARTSAACTTPAR